MKTLPLAAVTLVALVAAGCGGALGSGGTDGGARLDGQVDHVPAHLIDAGSDAAQETGTRLCKTSTECVADEWDYGHYAKLVADCTCGDGHWHCSAPVSTLGVAFGPPELPAGQVVDGATCKGANFACVPAGSSDMLCVCRGTWRCYHPVADADADADAGAGDGGSLSRCPSSIQPDVYGIPPGGVADAGGGPCTAGDQCFTLSCAPAVCSCVQGKSWSCSPGYPDMCLAFPEN